VLVVLFALLLLLFNLVPLAAEWLWFQALVTSVCSRHGRGRGRARRGVGGLVFAFLYVSTCGSPSAASSRSPLVVQISSGAAAGDVTRLLRRLALPTALGLALLFRVGRRRRLAGACSSSAPDGRSA